jgi:hypothetical protein
MKIRLAKAEDLEQVLNVLNDVTLDLQKKGINQWSYPWNREIIENAIKNILFFDGIIRILFFFGGREC